MEHIIKLWPSVSEFAADLRVPYTTAASWLARGNIPAKHDLSVVEAASKRGFPVTLEDLARARRVEGAA